LPEISKLDHSKSTQKTGEQHLPDTFSRTLEAAFSSKGQLCVGIDPHEEILIDNGYEVSASGVYEFSMKMLEQLEDVVSIVKPQVSFFERFGSEGFATLEKVLDSAKDRGFLVIADAKRGDIGSTMEAYAQAWLGKAAPFVCDALTVNPYLGVGALAPAASLASDRGKGLFVLAATSNPEGALLQSSTQQVTVAAQVANEVSALNSATATTNSRFGSLGLVIGATVSLSKFGLSTINERKSSLRTTILAPGFGYQGARLEDAKSIFGVLSGDVLYSISRSALRDGIHGVKTAVQQDQNTLHKALSE
jgi:orotidine-5'-phosphate decarboxylase